MVKPYIKLQQAMRDDPHLIGGWTAWAAPPSRAPLGLALFATMLSACAALYQPNLALESAQGEYEHTRSSEDVNLLAGPELARAGEALSEAQTAWRRHADKERVDQLCALVTQRLILARARASQRVDELRAMTREIEAEAKH